MTKANTPEWVKSELTHVVAAAARGQIEQTSGLRAQSAHYDTRKKLVLSCYAGATSAPKVANRDRKTPCKRMEKWRGEE